MPDRVDRNRVGDNRGAQEILRPAAPRDEVEHVSIGRVGRDHRHRPVGCQPPLEGLDLGAEERQGRGRRPFRVEQPVHRRPQIRRAVHQRDVPAFHHFVDARVTETEHVQELRVDAARADFVERRADVAGGGIVPLAKPRRADEDLPAVVHGGQDGQLCTR